MFLSDDFIYVDLNKTGSVSVINWLKKLGVPLIECHHHLKPSTEQIESDKIKFATIRDPWSYYHSLWSYGCKKKRQSGPYNSLTKFSPFRHRGFSNNRWGALKSVGLCFFRGLSEDWSQNKHFYSDAEDPKLFQSWIRKLLDSKTSVFLSGSYYSSGIQNFCGLYTYRFCNLYCKTNDKLHSGKIRNLPTLKSWTENNLYIDEFLNTGSLREDFVALIQNYNLVDDSVDLSCVSSTRMNASKSSSVNLADFYDDVAIELVAMKEKLIIDRFNFDFEDSTQLQKPVAKTANLQFSRNSI